MVGCSAAARDVQDDHKRHDDSVEVLHQLPRRSGDGQRRPDGRPDVRDVRLRHRTQHDAQRPRVSSAPTTNGARK